MREGEAVARGGEAFAEAVHAADGGNDPDVVADADAAVCVAVGPERAAVLEVARTGREAGGVRHVGVVQRAAQVRGEVVDVDMLADGDVARRMPDRHAVFDDVLAGPEDATGVLVPVRMDFDVVGGVDDEWPLLHGRQYSIRGHGREQGTVARGHTLSAPHAMYPRRATSGTERWEGPTSSAARPVRVVTERGAGRARGTRAPTGCPSAS